MSNATILTDGNGRPFVKPEAKNYANTTEFLRAYHAYQDAIADCANRSFDVQFRKSMKHTRTAEAKAERKARELATGTND
jgi:hypothetical protein